jgi:hypothetical protein
VCVADELDPTPLQTDHKLPSLPKKEVKIITREEVLRIRIHIDFGRLHPDPGEQKLPTPTEKKFQVLKCWMFFFDGFSTFGHVSGSGSGSGSGLT